MNSIFLKSEYKLLSHLNKTQIQRVFLVIAVFVILFHFPLSAQQAESRLTIRIEQKGSDLIPAAWIQILSEENNNIGGWYPGKGPLGFPAFSPVVLDVPSGKLTIIAWNRTCNPVTKEIVVLKNQPSVINIKLKPRLNLHRLGYFSFDSHNHLNGYEEKNRPPYIYPYCAARGIDHLDICQGWLFGLRMPVTYDSIVTYLSDISNTRLSLHFGSETPKLRYGHTWTINHPGLEEPFNDYLKWHDSKYFKAIAHKESDNPLDLRGSLSAKWHPPFVDRLRYKANNGFTVAAHPTRWWHTGPDEVFPATNVSADLAFDLLVAHSYDGIVVMGDHKDHIFYQNLWFHLLNLGHRLVPVAESDGNIDRGNLGVPALTYARTTETGFNFDSLLLNIQAGHTMLSGEATMLLNVDKKLPPGSELPADGKKHTIQVEVFSESAADEYVSFLVLYRNGEIIEKVDLRKEKKRVARHKFVVNENETAWYVVKSYGKVYPSDPKQFDVMAYAEACLTKPNKDYPKNTGISMTAPIYFNGPDWKAPESLVSHIIAKVVDKDGMPLKSINLEIWNIAEKIAEVTTDDQGHFEINAPATIDVRYTLPDGKKEQQWLFYEYPPLLDLIEDTYTLKWTSAYPGIYGGQMPWSAYHYDEIKEVLKEVHWTIQMGFKETM